MWKNWQFSKIPQTCTVSQERLQPMSDGKRHFIVGYFLCYSYKLILISPGIFHRALFEKWLTLVAEKSPESAKFTYSNLEAFNVHPPSYVILILKKMPFFIILLYPLPDKSPHLAAENLNVELTPWGGGGGGLKQAQKVNFGSVSDAFFCWFGPHLNRSIFAQIYRIKPKKNDPNPCDSV